jgi:hypothetical protein
LEINRCTTYAEQRGSRAGAFGIEAMARGATASEYLATFRYERALVSSDDGRLGCDRIRRGIGGSEDSSGCKESENQQDGTSESMVSPS